MKSSHLALALTLLLPALVPALRAAEPYPWKAAAASADITPSESVWLAGYAGRTEPSEGVRLPIFAKALALEDAEGGRFVFLTFDLIGIPRAFRDEVEAIAKESHGLAPERILMNASHTHSGPLLSTWRPPGEDRELAPYLAIPEDQQALRVRQIQEYRAFLAQTVDRLLGDSLGTLAPAELSWSRARCGFAMNRRTPDGGGGFRNFPHPDGPVDQEVPVLIVRDKADKGGERPLKAILFGYACHATTLSANEINGDWPGYAQAFLEEDHPGATALFLNGASGDQNPYPRRLLPYAERHGRALATAVETALETEVRPLAGPLRAALEWPEIPYQAPPSRAELEERAAASDAYSAGHAKLLMQLLDGGAALPTSYPVPVQVLRIGGDLVLAAIGGEVVVDYSLRIKRELGEGNAAVWFAGYTNEVMTYIPSLRVLEEGGYEGGGAMRYGRSILHPAPWDPSIEERLVGAVREMAGRLGAETASSAKAAP
jgi:neutral ceramidase